MSTITAVGTAFPSFCHAQTALKSAAAEVFAGLPRLDHLISVFDHAGVDRRHFCFNLDYYRNPRSFRDKNQDYLAQGLPLIEQATKIALEKAGVAPEQVDHLFFVTTTGIATPSLDAWLMNRIPFRRTVLRTPLYGLGCAAGAVGLSRAAEYVKLRRDHQALVISLELCGQTFDSRDVSPVNLIAAALFADGAACAVVQGDDRHRPGFEVIESKSIFFHDSLNMMGWDLADTGLRLVLSTELPALIRRQTRTAVEDLLRDHHLRIDDIQHWIVHPGGPRVMEALESALGLPSDALRHSRAFLREYGNLSSASVLYVMDGVLEQARPQPGEWAILTAAGPGFSFEFLLLRAVGAMK